MTFGQRVRAARLGFYVLDGRCLVRISDVGRSLWQVECHPLGLIRAKRGRRADDGVEYRRWWDDEDAIEAVRHLSCVEHYSADEGPSTFIVNDDGAEV